MDLGTDARLFARLEVAGHSFGVPKEKFDECVKLTDFHYCRSWDCYVSKADLAGMEQPASGCGHLH